MTTIQENLLKLLKEIDAICRKHDITYYLAGGTALGAVRNNGFLPWDDDMDLYITRDNWKKLEAVIDSEMRPDRGFASILRNELYRNPIARYVDKETTTIYQSQALAGAACGQHVEFMIMDPVPKDPEKYKEFRRLLLVYTELLTSYFVVNRQVVNKDSDFDYETYQYYLHMMEEKGREHVLKLLEDKIFSYPDSDDVCDYYCLRWGLHILMYERKNYGEPRYVDFEDGKFPVGSCAEGVFREAYGDTWMMIPETEEQETHNSLRSMTLSYTNYIQDYMQFMNTEEAIKKYWDYKKFRMTILTDREKTVAARQKLHALRWKLRVEHAIHDHHIDPMALLRERRYDELREAMQDYYTGQIRGEFFKWQILVEVDESILYPALMLLVIDGKYHQARKILKLCELHERMTPRLQEAQELVEAVRDISIAIYDHKSMEDARTVCEEWIEKYPDVRDLLRCDLQTGLYFAKSDGERQAALKKANALIERFPEDGEIWKLRGDCHLALEEKEEAVSDYLTARGRTRNGIVLNEMRKKLIALDVDPAVIESAPLL